MSLFRYSKKSIVIKVVLSIGTVLLLAASATGYFLKKGITVQEVSVGGLAVSEFSLIWKSRLELDVSGVSVDSVGKTHEEGGTPDTNETRDINWSARGVQAAYYSLPLFSRVTVNDLRFGGQSFDIALTRNTSPGYTLSVGSLNIAFSSFVSVYKDNLDIEIIEAVSERYKSTLKGSLRIDGPAETVSGNISAVINSSFPVAISFTADKEQLSFQGEEAGTITEITPLVDLFGLSHNIQRWITDYLSGSRYHLKSVKGAFSWDNPIEILDTLDAEVRVDDTEYTFAPGLEPIKGRYTDVFFQKGVLVIKPHDATFYGQGGGDSWLDIDFNDPSNILLTAYILTNASANDDILTLLNYYGIGLPFKQVEGKTATDLLLAINLNKLKIEAKGSFQIDEGVIEFGGNSYSISDANIGLVNSDVAIERMGISYEDMVTAHVSGDIQVGDKTGDIDIALQQVSLKLNNSVLSLNESAPVPTARYHFDPTGHSLDAQPSSWQFGAMMFELGAFHAPVIPEDLAVQIPPVHLGKPPGIVSEVSGYFSIRSREADFSCDLLKYQVKDLALESSHIVIDITYDKGLVFRTNETALLSLNKMPVTVYPSILTLVDDVLTVLKGRISYGSLFDSSLTGSYNKRNKQGKFFLDKIDAKDSLPERRLVENTNFFLINGAGGKFVVTVPHYDLVITTDQEKNWSASFGDLSKIYDKSAFLQKFKISEGSFVASSTNGKKPYKFSADIKAPLPLLVEGGKPVDYLVVVGQIDEQGVTANVNNALDFSYAGKRVHIASRDLGYNLASILQLLKDNPLGQPGLKTDQDTANSKPFSFDLEAVNSQLYLSPKNSLLADRLDLKYQDGKVVAKLNHGAGQILFQHQNSNFMIDGTDLNDQFMGALIHKSSFTGGSMSITSAGAADNFPIIFVIKDTVLSNLATLNNVMALLNTVPALITFSVPNYSRSGLPVSSAVVGMTVKDKVASFESMEIVTPGFVAKGKGWINFSESKMDVDINLRTEASINVGKIPLAGIVLVGPEGSSSTSMKITGSVSDPEVSNTLIKDLAVYPLEILGRILKLPYYLLKKLGGTSKE